MAISQKEIILTVSTAALAFVGALLGSYLTSRFDQSNWETRFELEQKRTILDKRVSLIEKTVALFNRVPTVTGLRGNIEHGKALLALEASCLSSQPRGGKDCDLVTEPGEVERSAKEIQQLNAEFASTMTLNTIYFGPETKKAVQALSATDDPWAESVPQRQALIDAMGRELNKFRK